MPIPTAAFTEWTRSLDGSGHELSLKDMSVATGIPRATISLQRTRGRVQASTVMRLARAYGRSGPLELGKFPTYETLRDEPKEYALELLATLVPPADLLKLILKTGGYLIDSDPLGEIPDRTTLGRWAERLASKERREKAATSLGVRLSDLTRAFREHKVGLDRIVDYATALGEHPHLGLYAAGEIEAGEAGIENPAETIKELPIGVVYQEYELVKHLVDTLLESIPVDVNIRRNLA